ncbi:MAG: ComEA family DNA-binding protein [Candidatus Loosdrechtia sp.]|uniref:ComEA family DNA-binding protein n=1 Tax=Candidatus Loosdrechtia sp. TaxID=3101272 RepID=UPI003A7873FD|nr:MAG: ComEA family DNA-binding protein [Candidatus Jettenia sp. AMX2]
MQIFRKYCGMTILILFITLLLQVRFCYAGEKLEGKVNINTAAESQIALLPGIGPKLAKDVIAYRENNGNFETAADIIKVKGVGNKKFEKMKDYITVEGDTTIQSTRMTKTSKESK